MTALAWYRNCVVVGCKSAETDASHTIQTFPADALSTDARLCFRLVTGRVAGEPFFFVAHACDARGCVCVCVCVCVCARARARVCMSVCGVCFRVYECFLCTCMNVYVLVCVCACVCVRMRAC